MSLRSSGFWTPIDRGTGVQYNFTGTSCADAHDGLQWEQSSKALSSSQSLVVLPVLGPERKCSALHRVIHTELKNGICVVMDILFQLAPNCLIFLNFVLVALLTSSHIDVIHPLL